MKLGSLKAKRDILRSPLRKFKFMTRWTLKLILIVFGHLIYIDRPERLKSCPWPAIFALNHNNYSESVLVPCILIYLCGGKKVSFLVHWVFKLFPFLNWMLKQINPIWIYNRRARVGWINKLKPLRQQDIFKQALLRFKNGQSVGIFPEGSRNNNPYTLKRGRMGLGRMVLESEVPVLPIGIDFPLRIKRDKIPFLGRIILRIGKPLYFSNERKKYNRPRIGGRTARTGEKSQQAAQARDQKQMLALYSEVSHRIMKEISRLCGKVYPYSI